MRVFCAGRLRRSRVERVVESARCCPTGGDGEKSDDPHSGLVAGVCRTACELPSESIRFAMGRAAQHASVG